MNSRFSLLAGILIPAALIACALVGIGCDGAGDGLARAQTPATRAPEAAHEDGHDHGAEAEASDLDRTVEDLMDDACEHDVLTHRCDECRYEVGVAKVAPDLLDQDGPLRTARVERRLREEATAHSGEVRLNEARAAHVGPRSAGTVREILVDLGERVRKGQILFTVESPEIAEARAAYAVATASLKLAEETLSRERDLYEKRICPRKDLLEAEAARDEAAATHQAALDVLFAHGLTANDLGDPTSNPAQTAVCPVRAPFDGTVLERNLSLGSQVEPGEPLLLVGDTSEVWVWTSLYERELAGVLAAQADGPIGAHVEVPAYPDRLFRGRVERIGGTVDEATRTARVRVVVDNGEGLLRAGMFAKVHLDGDESDRTLAVPAEAVLEDEGRSFVFVPVEPPYFMRRPVMTGQAWGDWVEVLQGLEEGDAVVSRGAFALKSDVLRSKMGAGCAD